VFIICFSSFFLLCAFLHLSFFRPKIDQLDPNENVYYYDDLCLGTLFQAVLLFECDKAKQAEEKFLYLFEHEQKIALGKKEKRTKKTQQKRTKR
jgi:hypothetical protein